MYVDYTPDGIKFSHMEATLTQMYDINKSLKKISRSLSILALLGIATMAIKHKDDIKKLKNTKGE